MLKKIRLITISLISLSSLALGQIKISGLAYADYFYNVLRDSTFSGANAPKNAALTGPKNFNGFQFRRIYLTFDNDISEKLTTRFRFEDDQIAATSGAANNLFVKDAFLRWKNIFPGSDITLGEQPTPVTEISEGAWGFRSIEKVPLDLHGIVSTRDLGISLRGRIDADGNYNYSVLIGNNSNTSPASNKYKRYYFDFLAKPFTNFQLSLHGDYAAYAPAAGSHDNDKAIVSLLLGYGIKDSYNISAEVFSQNAANGFKPVIGGVSGSTESIVARGYAVYGWYNFVPEFGIVLRYDYFDPNTSSADNAKSDSRHLLIAGVNWKVDKSVAIQPNIEYETYEEKPATGTIPAQPYDASLNARLTVYYQF